jgi:membrane protease YdiL (CAAX protease family)
MLDALLKGPPAYVARGGWPAWAVIPAAFGIIGVALLGTVAVWFAIRVVTGVTLSVSGNGYGLPLLFGAWQIFVVLLTLAAARFHAPDRAEALALRPPAQGWRVLPVALLPLFLVGGAWTGIISFLNPDAVLHDLRPFQQLLHGDAFWLMLLVIGLGAPLSEEILFRGFMFPGLAKSRLGFVGAGILSSILWTMLHAGYSLFGLLEVLSIGFYFAWLLVRTGSLWTTIFCHAVYNTVMAVGLYFVNLPPG